MEETITITLAVHPLRGLQLPLVREIVRTGTHYVEVEHPLGWRVFVPRAWTDRDVAPLPARGPTGDALRVSMRGLAALCSALQVISQEALDGWGNTVDDAHAADLLSPVIDGLSPSTACAPAALGGVVGPRTRRSRRDVGGAGPGGGAGVPPADGGTP